MNELQTKLNLINEEASKITPEVLKKNTTIFNVTGTYETPTPKLQSKSITITDNGTQTVTADAGNDGLSSVEITTNVASSGGGIEQYINLTPQEITGATSVNGWRKLIKELPGNIKTPPSLNYVFKGYQYFTNLSFMKTWDYTDTTNTEYMFYNVTNSNITEIDLSEFKPKSWYKAGGMFYGCKNLTKINLKNVNKTPSSYSNMFYNVPTTVEIITNSTFASWLQAAFPSYTNITIVKADWE